jgi:tetratricopeptide (TPR) repeat protein
MRALKLIPRFHCGSLCGLLGIAVLASPALAQTVGDKVVVVREAEIKIGDKTMQKIERGTGLTVQSVKGGWVWVSHKTTGWIRIKDVTTPEQAVMTFTEQITRDPNDAAAYVARGSALFDDAELDLALEDFNQALKLDSKNRMALIGRGLCSSEKGEPVKAVADYTEAIRLDPNDAIAHHNRAIARFMKGEMNDAIADETETLRLSPQMATALLIRGRAWHAKKEYAKALDDFREALKFNPKYAEVYNGMGWLHAICPDQRFRSGEKAVEFATKACELTDWQNSNTMDTLAAAYAESGDFKKAVEWETKALEIAADEEKPGFESRVELYKSEQPYRDEPRKIGKQADGKAKKTARNRNQFWSSLWK